MRVLIVEDELHLAESIRDFLKKEGYQCDLAPDFAAGEEKIHMLDYDCILLDINLPDGNGLKLMEQIKTLDKMDGVIIISARDSLDDKVKGLSLGADDYIAKPFHLTELSARIGALIRRKQFRGSNKIVFKELSIDVQVQTVKVHDVTVMLTRKEYDLLLYLISNKGRVISKNAIAEHLSGDMADMLDNFGFLYAHVKNLKKKLAESGCADYIKTIYGFGYQWDA